MTLPKLLVTGATGKTGAAVVQELLDKNLPVRVVVRRRDARAEALAKRGVEIAVADVFDADQMFDALRGVQRAYYVSPFDPYMIQATATFAVAAHASKLEAIVQMGQWLSHPSHPAIMTRQTWLMDHLFAGLPGISHTILNPGMFADNFLRVINFASLLGVYPVLTGNGKAAPVSNEDIAKVAAAVLMAPERHGGATYRPTGPKLLSGREMAQVAATVVGHRVVPINLPFWMFRKVARQQRLNPLEISGFRFYVEEMKRGAFEIDGGVTDVVERLTGTPAESFETTARRYAGLPFARQTLGNRLRAFLTVNLTPFYVGYDLERWDRERGFPMPSNSSLSIDDRRWQAEHTGHSTNASATSRVKLLRAG